MSTSTHVPVEVPGMEQHRTLNAIDRCDRCGAQAYVATEHSGSELLWCAHHFRAHEEKLNTAKVVDERAKINIAASISATTT